MELRRLLASPPPPGRNWPRSAFWHQDEDGRLAVIRFGHGKRALDLLAYGLQHLDGRELHLVVPREAVAATRARAAFLDAPVHVHRTQDTGFRDAEPHMDQTEARQFFRKLGGLTPLIAFDTSSWPSWLVDVASSLESRDVDCSQTTRSVVWRYQGRQVLAVRPASSGTLALTAGADFTTSGSDRLAPVRRTVTATTQLTSPELDELRSTIDTAIERRRQGEDPGHRERLLQATISADPGLIGMTQLRREVPAWRPRLNPYRGRAYIDLLGRDIDRTGHVIEVKIRPASQLGIQALDYWAWAQARSTKLAETVGADTDRPFQLDVVLGSQAAKSPLHPAAVATLQAMVSTVRWRCHLIFDWDTTDDPARRLTPKAETLPPGQLPKWGSCPHQ